MPLAVLKLSFTPACSRVSCAGDPEGVERHRLVLGALEEQDGDRQPGRIGRQALVAEAVAARALHASAGAGGEALLAIRRFALGEDDDLLDALGLDAEVSQQLRQKRPEVRLMMSIFANRAAARFSNMSDKNTASAASRRSSPSGN